MNRRRQYRRECGWQADNWDAIPAMNAAAIQLLLVEDNTADAVSLEGGIGGVFLRSVFDHACQAVTAGGSR